MSGLPEVLRKANVTAVPVGSRVTCNPPPVGTDEDWLVLIDPAPVWEGTNTFEAELEGTGGWSWTLDQLAKLGWEFEGDEHYANNADNHDPNEGFRSYRNGDVNLILTMDTEFYRRFLAATTVAKRLNLLDKDDRVALFQAVLYGNECETDKGGAA